MSSTSNPWLYAGPASALTNIEPSLSAAPKTKIAKTTSDDPPPCIILQLPSSSSPNDTSSPQRLTPTEAQQTIGLSPQILIFRYRNKLHAINHSCPHRTHPLSRGSLYDIEDFGIIFSAGITCPGHGWAFDVNTGLCDRGSYKLQVWVRRKEG
jgi:nitrite reductase/ring-hydroxylating ferredoxin subunit